METPEMCEEKEAETGSDCPDCHVPCILSKTVRNEETCPKCNLTALHFSGGGLGTIIEVIDHFVDKPTEGE